MKIFKNESLTKENFERLTSGLMDGELLITKKGIFFVADLIKVTDRPVEGIEVGRFQKLEHAVLFGKNYEKHSIKYEYFFQKHDALIEGLKNESFQAMGELGWELCAVNKEGVYIFKREIVKTISLSKVPSVKEIIDKVKVNDDLRACESVEIIERLNMSHVSKKDVIQLFSDSSVQTGDTYEERSIPDTNFDQLFYDLIKLFANPLLPDGINTAEEYEQYLKDIGLKSKKNKMTAREFLIDREIITEDSKDLLIGFTDGSSEKLTEILEDFVGVING